MDAPHRSANINQGYTKRACWEAIAGALSAIAQPDAFRLFSQGGDA